MHPIIYKLEKIKNNVISINKSPEVIRVFLKEELQNYILHALYSDSRTSSLIFYGGTCLKKIFNINRLSEDLDFETDQAITEEVIVEVLNNYFRNLKFEDVEYKIQKGDKIHRITLKFPVLYNLNLAPMENEKLYVKVEINHITKLIHKASITPIQKDNLAILIRHYPIETMMAGKILACLTRIYKKGASGIEIKGRDYFDLIWYMQNQIHPDMLKLEELGSVLGEEEVFDLLDKKITKILSKDLLIDLQYFFEDYNYIKTWCENFQEIYNNLRKNYKNISSTVSSK